MFGWHPCASNAHVLVDAHVISSIISVIKDRINLFIYFCNFGAICVNLSSDFVVSQLIFYCSLSQHWHVSAPWPFYSRLLQKKIHGFFCYQWKTVNAFFTEVWTNQTTLFYLFIFFSNWLCVIFICCPAPASYPISCIDILWRSCSSKSRGKML